MSRYGFSIIHISQNQEPSKTPQTLFYREAEDTNIHCIAETSQTLLFSAGNVNEELLSFVLVLCLCVRDSAGMFSVFAGVLWSVSVKDELMHSLSFTSSLLLFFIWGLNIVLVASWSWLWNITFLCLRGMNVPKTLLLWHELKPSSRSWE